MNQQVSSALSEMPESEKTVALVRMAGRLAHELNNIFTTVIGNVALLDESKVPGAETVLSELRKGIERGIELSSNLQAFAGMQPLKRKHVDINRTIEETFQSLSQTLLSGFDLRIALARPSPIVFLDEEKFRVSLFEIARNASRSMRGIGALSVEARLIRGSNPADPIENDAIDEPDEVEINITDTGIGMPPDVVEHAMDPMFSTKASQASAGWGLSRVSGFVRQSGGSIKLRSIPDSGTCVSFRLPVTAVREN